ncbi:hypothetical protein [Marinilabilia salmonicolor]|uniref:hypothetical protein n=1 Tax=Marinilabilia salmonicolor TaxID=989 RepID=UPI001F1D815F|nr:hypothetical protein [Marinilabilia salmonicolor]
MDLIAEQRGQMIREKALELGFDDVAFVEAQFWEKKLKCMRGGSGKVLMQAWTIWPGTGISGMIPDCWWREPNQWW